MTIARNCIPCPLTQATSTSIANTASSAAINAPKELAKAGYKLVLNAEGQVKLIGDIPITNLDAVNVVGKSGTTVLGKFPNYINLANQLGANRFSIPKNIFNKMSPTQQWNANTKFLDRAILRNDDIFLSDSPLDLNKFNGAFKKEIEYMIEKGFKVNSMGTKLLNQ